MKSVTRQVVILAGGLGTRLAERTRQKPKPIIPVAGKAYLEWQIELLRGHGLRDFLLLTGYRAEQIEAHFGNGNRWGVKISYSREPQPLGTAAALRLAEPKIGEHFLLMNGDTFFPIDYTAFLRRADSTPDNVWLVAVPKSQLGPSPPQGNVGLDKGQLSVIEYVRGGRENLDFVHAGMFVLSRSWLSQMQGGAGASVESALCPALIKANALRAYVCNERFYDMGTPQQLQELEVFLTSYQRKSK
jgi:NDP-sugar pyrophosphorylase family protein